MGHCKRLGVGLLSKPGPLRSHRLNAILDRIRGLIENHGVVLFMKGTPEYPMCGFSAQAVEALRKAGAANFFSVNVLEDAEVRANLPRFSNWQTFPQLFLNGELIGGADILQELQECGELERIIHELAQAA